jgi:GTPase involved in cell partitioning and DNA repair
MKNSTLNIHKGGGGGGGGGGNNLFIHSSPKKKAILYYTNSKSFVAKRLQKQLQKNNLQL